MRATPSSFSLPGGSLCVCTGLHSITPAVKKWSRVARLIAGSDLKFARDARFVIVRSSLREGINSNPAEIRSRFDSVSTPAGSSRRFSFGYYTNICSFLPRRKYKSRFVCMHTCTSKKRISAASIFREEGFAGSLRPYFSFFLSFEESNPVPIPRQENVFSSVFINILQLFEFYFMEQIDLKLNSIGHAFVKQVNDHFCRVLIVIAIFLKLKYMFL